MAADSFAKDGLGWQIQQTQQRVSEWLELQFMRDAPDLPQGSFPTLPAWLGWSIFWFVFALAVAWLLWLSIQLFWPDVQRWLNGGSIRSPSLLSRPQVPTTNAAEWLKRSQQHQKNGNYGEACRALYMAMLEHLHDHDDIPRKLSRTDGEYQTCVQHLPQPDPYQLLLQVHEQLYFGSADISADVFRQCQQAYQAIAKR